MENRSKKEGREEGRMKKVSMKIKLVRIDDKKMDVRGVFFFGGEMK